MTSLSVSDMAWDGFTVSWTPAGGDFDSFVLEITNLENLEESQNLTLSGGASSLAVSGLNPNTSYVVGLFGVYQDSVLEPLYTEAATGTCSCQRAAICPLAFFPRFILYSPSAFLCTRTSLFPLTVSDHHNNLVSKHERFNKRVISHRL